LLAALSAAVYTASQMAAMSSQAEEWKEKYEEAIIDVMDAHKRLEEKEKQLQEALVEAQLQRAIAEEALKNSQQQRGRK
jgi:hypothetical protein